MAAPQRRLEKVLGHLQAHTNGLTCQETAGAELSDNDVVIVRYVCVCGFVVHMLARLFGRPRRVQGWNCVKMEIPKKK